MNVFIISHEQDDVYVRELLKHLTRVTSDNIHIVTTHTILASDDLERGVKSQLRRANIAVIFLSSDLFADSFLYELREAAIKQTKRAIFLLVQVIARPVFVEPPPKVDFHEPLNMSHDRDTVYIEMVEVILYKIRIINLRKKIRELERRLKEALK
jgi:Rps23 Pro-64 3,4-dihydroxylase Tpa1-like proline 4-hydroxylase